MALNFLCIVKMHENQKANLASSLFEREEKLAPLISLFKRITHKKKMSKQINRF